AVLTFSKPSSHLLPVLRPYTPITHASTPGHLDLLVKHYPSGKQSTHLHSLSPGDSLAFVTAIPGYAWQRNRFRRIACIAGGAGVTPVWQLVQGILADPDDKTVVDVVYGANSVEDVLLREEWGRLVEKSRGRLRVHYTVSRGGEEGGEFRKGYVTKELLRELGVQGGKGEGEGEETSMVFVCGPPKMEEALVGKGRGGSGGILAELGFRKEQVYKF
ncbi:NADH-cytochrome b5 reductase, partial [Lasiodiplodia theobromae]|uniref:NADH-cytochrome b5 reductase n=1 Tax=Lasiodiplodia theobromae TaxID=45133 RepID=UPI0015C3032E